MAAAVACSLFPPLRLMLDEDSGEGSLPPPMRLHIDEDALFSDEDSTASVPLSTTSTTSTILICNEEMEDSDILAPTAPIDLTHERSGLDTRTLVILEEELQDYHDPREDERFMKKVLAMDVRPYPQYSTQVERPSSQSSSRRPTDHVIAPEGHSMVLVGLFKLGGAGLIKDAPQVDMPPDGPGRCLRDGYHFLAQGGHTPGDIRSFYETTEHIGRYLILRGFPIINKSGSGSGTLVFRISKDRVAKVSRYDRAVDHVKWERHRRERNLDVLLSRAYPQCFAKTTYHWVTPQEDALLEFRHEVYIQELLNPLLKKPDAVDWFMRYPNGNEIHQMIDQNRGTKFNQWGFTLDGRLVCYDYQ